MARRKHHSPVSLLKRGISILVIVLLTALAVAYCIFAYRRTGTVFPTRELVDGLPAVRFVDVGQGDCTLVTFKGDSVLIDAGPASSGNIAAEYVRMYAPVLDYFIITHPHEDHMGGAPFIFDAVKVENLILTTDVVDEEFYIQTIESALDEGTNIIYLDSPEVFEIGEIDITFLDVFGLEHDDLNDASLIIRIDAPNISVLVTGDAESAEEAYTLMNNPEELLDCDILKVAHHGSSSSTSSNFLSAVSPDICVISCGRGNSYGHPSNDVLARISEIGADIRRTDVEGNIVIRPGSK